MDGDLNKTSILVVDDEEILRDRLVMAFRNRGFAARGAKDYDDAMQQAQEDPPELATVDLRMPGRSGLSLVQDLKKLEPSMRVVVLTGYGSIATAIDAVKLGATHYLQKPVDADEVLAAFQRNSDEPLTEPTDALKAPSLARAEWEHINRVLSDCGNNISEAARRLGIHRRSLQRKLQKYPPLS
ncbi:MAG: response regulator [Polyangiaceae bacterium]|nr:response regulator [Polyangiaceae bacterium]MCW5789130.1 response regulator [Polyangiaceae bacterium]